MLNPAVVNAKPPCAIPADFCENMLEFQVDFRISKNPLNMCNGLILTIKRCIQAAPGAMTRHVFSRIINAIAGP